ncbi:hypothetical protein Q7A53_05525 [Halobacillus rhizosphaerae]|uniref:hypothetical protein n=1 Tax=Halobacillus rhizosphaerae TaxID=3064889 RepID=UPI00398A691A
MLAQKNEKEMVRFEGQRKHLSQMQPKEIFGIYDRLKSVKHWRVSTHTFDRIKEKKIDATKKDLVSIIHNSRIVEYRIIRNRYTDVLEERVVLESKPNVNRKYWIKVCYSLTENKIITTWMNDANDLHSTLDRGIYSKKMKVFGI